MNTEPKERDLDAAKGCITGVAIMLPVWVVVIGLIAAWVLK